MCIKVLSIINLQSFLCIIVLSICNYAPKFCLFFLFLQCRAKNKCFSHTGHFPRKPWGLTQNDLGKTGCGFPFRSSLSLLLNLGVLASPPRSSVLSWGSGVPSALLLFVRVLGLSRSQLPAYLCVYIYISPGSFPISFLDTNNPHCIGRTTWHLALHCIALHCIALQYIALHYIALHGITLHYIASHCIAFIALHCIAMHCITLHCISLHCITFNCITLHRIALHCIAPVRRKPVFHVGVSYQEFFSGIL